MGQKQETELMGKYRVLQEGLKMSLSLYFAIIINF